MKLKNLFIVVVLLSISLLFTGCADKYYETYVDEHNTIVEGGNAYIFSFNDIAVDGWNWNEDRNRYESPAVALEGLNADIYEYGIVMVSMFVEEEDIEVSKNLPYEKDFFKAIQNPLNPTEIIKAWDFTQRFSFDMTVDDIVFYIESTDKFELKTCNFKVVVVWDGIIEE